MTTKRLTLSSSGLKKVIFTKTKDIGDIEEFRFIFGKEELKTNYLFAEFISPRVSRIHQTDPTINSLDLTDYYQRLTKSNQIVKKTIVEKVDELSRGHSIDITEEMIKDLEEISILLGNIELYRSIQTLFPTKTTDEKLSKAILSLQFIENDIFDFQNDAYEREGEEETNIDYISSHFYMIDEEELLKIPIRILYLIINNEHLILKDEDSLFDFINKLFHQKTITI